MEGLGENMRMINLIFFILVSITINCASARVVSSMPGEGGTIAIAKGFKGDEAEANARSIMERNCSPKKVKIKKEGEVVIGTQTNVKEDTNLATQNKQKNFTTNTSTANVSRSGQSTTTNISEWQVEYICE